MMEILRVVECYACVFVEIDAETWGYIKETQNSTRLIEQIRQIAFVVDCKVHEDLEGFELRIEDTMHKEYVTRCGDKHLQNCIRGRM